MSDYPDSQREEPEDPGRGRDVVSELDRESDQEILEVIEAESSLHVMDIAKAADRHPVTVDQTCARLHERGLIRPVGRGIYELTEDGKLRITDTLCSG